MAAITGTNGFDIKYGTDASDTFTLLDGGDYAYGGLGSDVFYGGEGWDGLYGGVGLDTVFGGWGDDDLYGEEDADLLHGEYGDDEAYGGAGADKIYGGYGSDSRNCGAGSDFIEGGHGDDTIYGDSSFSGTPQLDGADTLYGGEGHDSVIGGRGADIMRGGNGDDMIDVGMGAEMTGDSVDGGAGIDLLKADYRFLTSALAFTAKDYLASHAPQGGFTFINIEQYEIRGTNFADQISGWLLDDDLRGGNGADNLSGLGGEDSLWGGGGADILTGGNGDDDLWGDDTGYYDPNEGSVAGADQIYGGDGDDSAMGGDRNDRIDGGNGDDVLSGQADDDSVNGGSGNDDLRGGAGKDTVLGGTGNDDLWSVEWTDDDDSVHDVLDGGLGSDWVSMGVNDKAVGGDQAGTVDTVHMYFAETSIGVTYDLATQGQTLTNLQAGNLLWQVGGFEAITFHGGSGRDVVVGAGRADALHGGKGTDLLRGGAGNDILDGDDGADFVSGEGGNDILYDGDTSWSTGKDTISGGDGNDQINDGRGVDLLYGGAGNDEFDLGYYVFDDKGNTLNNLISGGAGRDLADYSGADMSLHLDLQNQALNDGAGLADILNEIEHVRGTSYDDYLLGNGADNEFEGGAQDDVLSGRAGNDTLDGGAGADEMTGGTGDDFFVLERDDGWFSHQTYWPHDTIKDFTKGQDELSILRSEFEITAAQFAQNGKGLANNATTNTTTISGPAFIFEQDAKRLWFDADGVGTDEDAILLATLQGVSSLSKSDFQIYDLL